MLIKVIKNGEMSEWREHNPKIHKEMLNDRPEYVVIYMKDFYKNSIDADKTEIISFDVFDYIYREARLKQLSEENYDKKYLVYNHNFDNDPDNFDMLEEIIRREEYKELFRVLSKLNAEQRERVMRKYFENMSGEQIAEAEGVSKQAVNKSIKKALEKLYKLLK